MRLLDFERQWLVTILETAVPLDGLLADTPRRLPLERFVDELMAAAPLHFTLGLRACTWLVMLAPLPVLGQLSTFMGLAPGDRAQLFERLGSSDRYLVRELPLLFKMVACLGICGVPEVQRSVGIPTTSAGPAWARRALPTVGGDGGEP